MSAHNGVKKLLEHNIRVASVVRDEESLLERTERSFSLARSYCHGKTLDQREVPWEFVKFSLGGADARNYPENLPVEHNVVVENVTRHRHILNKNMGSLAAKIELQVPLHQTFPVPRAIWAGRLRRPSPRYEINRRGSDQFAFTVAATIRDPHIGTGSVEHKYFGDSDHVVPFSDEANKIVVPVFGFILSASGIERSDTNFPAIVYGRENILSILDHDMPDSPSWMHLRACLNQVDLQNAIG